MLLTIAALSFATTDFQQTVHDPCGAVAEETSFRRSINESLEALEYRRTRANLRNPVNSPSTVRRPIEYQKSTSVVLCEGLRTFKGKSPQFAFNKIGYPDKQSRFGATIVYSWSNTTSNIDGSQLYCTIKAMVRAGKIFDTEYSGNAGACSRYAVKFAPTDIR